jgi:hypothetical protein
MFSTLLFIFFIVLPAISIFAYVSRLTSGIYHWADRQHPTPNYRYETTQTETIYTLHTETRTKTRPISEEENYFGHSPQFEDSREFAELLDSKRFDVRDYLK